MYYALFGQMKKQLGQMDKWFDAAAQFAEQKTFSPDVYLAMRLAPDQLPFVRQVQIACDTAKLGASRLTGKEAPKHDDAEQTLEELRTRVKDVVGYLNGFQASDFDGAAERSVTQPRWQGKTMSGHDYFMEHVVPNFFFHATHVYALLRHNGVNLGKKDYLGQLTMRDPASS